MNPDGTFDPSFGSGGRVISQPGAGSNPYSFAEALALQADGRIVVGGDASDASGSYKVLVLRLNPDGSFDSSFGAGGTVTVQLGVGANPYSRVDAIAVQGDTKVVLGAFASDASHNEELVVARLNADGSIDSSFGTGGNVTAQLGAGSAPFTEVAALALQGDGKIMLDGYASDASGGDLLLVARLIGDLPPSAGFSVLNNPVLVGKPVAFDGSTSSDPDGTISTYHWQFGDGTGASAIKPTHTFSAPGSYTVTLTVTDNDGLINATAKTILVPIPPRISHARLTHKRFRVSKHATATAVRRRRSQPQAPLGTRFRFTLSAPAKLLVAITHKAAGIRRGRRCVAPPRKHQRRHAKRCTRILKDGMLTRSHEHQGNNQIAFSGRIGHKKLRPGAYKAALTATNPAGRSKAVTLSFRIVR